MVIGFSRTWQRPPTREELDGLDPRPRARGSSITAKRWRWAWTGTTRLSGAGCNRSCSLLLTMSPRRPEPTDAELAEY